MEFKTDESGKRGVLKIDGALTVRNIEEAKALLLSSLRSVEELRIDLDGLTEVDLCGLQLGCSFKRTATRLGRKIVYPSAVPPAVSRAVGEAGACFHAGCDLAGKQCFFWKRGIA